MAVQTTYSPSFLLAKTCTSLFLSSATSMYISMLALFFSFSINSFTFVTEIILNPLLIIFYQFIVKRYDFQVSVYRIICDNTKTILVLKYITIFKFRKYIF